MLTIFTGRTSSEVRSDFLISFNHDDKQFVVSRIDTSVPKTFRVDQSSLTGLSFNDVVSQIVSDTEGNHIAFVDSNAEDQINQIAENNCTRFR